MYERSLKAARTAPGSPTDIDYTIWEKVNAAVGGSARFSAAVMIEGRTSERPIMVVVVERHGLPGDEDLRRRFRLTPRESEVARLMADRLSSEEISGRLGISVNTARSHSERVLRKLAVHTRNRVRTALLDPDYAPACQRSRSVA